jgi:phenylacetate-CoA ligase
VPQVFQTYASADVGSMAYETATGGKRNPGMVLDEDVMLEIVRPGSGEPVAPGDIGEVLITLFNEDYPLMRFATGDMSALLVDAPPSPCGRTNAHQGLDGSRRPDHQGARDVRAPFAGGQYRAPPP